MEGFLCISKRTAARPIRGSITSRAVLATRYFSHGRRRSPCLQSRDRSRSTALRMAFTAANPRACAKGSDELVGKSTPAQVRLTSTPAQTHRALLSASMAPNCRRSILMATSCCAGASSHLRSACARRRVPPTELTRGGSQLDADFRLKSRWSRNVSVDAHKKGEV